MSLFDEIEKLNNAADPRNVKECDSLLRKFGIPIERFEFSYVEKCSDGRELEKILQVLRSGEEGYYPELIKCTEDRLAIIKPKSKYLRKTTAVLKKNDLKEEEVKEISSDLQTFVKKVSKNDKELIKRKTKKEHCDVEIRQEKKDDSKEEKKNTEKRISSTDYKSWDKYDPDTEILKMDLEEEQLKKTAIQEVTKDSNKPKKSVSFNQYATEAEAIFNSEREREKGNEFFKTGDYEEALQCYTSSIQSKITVNNLNNRAVTYLKLKKYQEAVKDCDKVLTLDKSNFKANSRKAEALYKLERYNEALEAVELAIQVDPNNTAAQNLAESIRKKLNIEVKNTRIKIVEIEE